MEAFHPLDFLNARIYDSTIVNSEKMGEFSIGVESKLYDTDLKLYYLPTPATPITPGQTSRLRINESASESKWINGDDTQGSWSNHFLIALEKSFEDYDIQTLIHKGIDRNNAIVGTLDYQQFGQTTIPTAQAKTYTYYHEFFAAGFGVVYNFEDFQLKGSYANYQYISTEEILTTNGLVSIDDHQNMTIGIEKNIEHRNSLSSTFYVEYQKIVSEDDDKEYLTGNDLFLGWKFLFNDINSKEINLSAIYDLTPKDEGLIQLLYSQRFQENYKFQAGIVHYFLDDRTDEVFNPFKKSDHLFLNTTLFY